MAAAKEVKVMTPNQSSALAAPRRSLPTACTPSSARVATSKVALMSCCGPYQAMTTSPTSDAQAGTKMRGARHWRRSVHSDQAASGQAGQVYQLETDR